MFSKKTLDLYSKSVVYLGMENGDSTTIFKTKQIGYK